jgi:flagellar FliJ protein
MKKFNFKLQTVLRLKEFNENKVKIELGQINKKREKIRVEIKKCHENIKTAKNEENSILQNPVGADFITFYPRYIRAQNNKIALLEQELEVANEEYDEKLKELSRARGEVKTFEKLKEKAHDKYKQDLRRKEILDAEEAVNAKRHREQL